MTITVTEMLEGSREGERAVDGSRSDNRQLVYHVSGTDDDDAALDAVESAAPTTYNGLIRRRYSIRALAEEDWQVTVKYDKAKRLEVNEEEYEFDIGLQNVKFFQSLGTTRYAASGTAPDFQSAINVQDGKVEGCDVGVPTYTFSKTKILAATAVDATYRGILYNLAGKKNNATFGPFAAGELLFLGARGRSRNEDEVSLTYSFSASPNVSSLTIGGITGISKKGWDFLWCIYADFNDSGSGRVVKRPQFAYVEKVIEDGDFSGLGITL